jgi:predicted tellurium resistance membrane protein TerC
MTEINLFGILISFFTLFFLELVLGIDNIIFISILSSKLPIEKQDKARKLGLSLAVLTRVLLLLSISWVVSLTNPFLTVMNFEISGKSLILIFGGLFLIAKSTHEIHQKLEADEQDTSSKSISINFASVIVQIMLLDIVFSLDSVITAVGMVNNIPVMIAAVVFSTLVMIFTSGAISRFIEKHPTLKILALSFLLLVGVTLIAEGFNQHISKGYIYFAMSFSIFVEAINIKMKKKSSHVELNKTWK